MNVVSAQLRRISVHTATKRVDLVLPMGETLDHALAVAGARLRPEDRVFAPGGTAIDTATLGADLREGGLYAIARVRAVSSEVSKPKGEPVFIHVLPCGALAGALTAAVIAGGGAAVLQRHVTAAIVGLVAFALACAAALRAGPHPRASEIFSALLLGGIAGLLSTPGNIGGNSGDEWDAMFACCLSFAGVAVSAMVLAAFAGVHAVQAAAESVALSAIIAAIFAASCLFIGWGADEFFIVVAALSMLMMRALPALILPAAEGYFIDYARHLTLRWTVRKPVVRYIERIATTDVQRLVDIAEARFRAANLLLAVLAVPGIILAAIPLFSGSLTEKIGSGAFICCAITALLLLPRRTFTPPRKHPQHAAALAGALGVSAIFAAISALPAFSIMLTAGVLLFAGVLVAAASFALQRGVRSLAFSRAADIVEALALALLLPAALLATGTIELLRGVFS